MKSTIVALSGLSLLGSAAAQTVVTLFGVVDIGVSYYQANSKFQSYGSAPATPMPDLQQSQWVLSNGGNAGGRLGLRGQEDLGGGIQRGLGGGAMWAVYRDIIGV